MQNLETYLEVQKNNGAEKIHELEDTVEILSEQIESLKLELDLKDRKLSEIAEELSYTNHELCILNEEFANTLASTNINRVEKSVNKSSASKKPAKSNIVSPAAFEKVGA